MQEPFPFLLDAQVALIRAEYNTGIVVDKNYARAMGGNQQVYTVYSNSDEALQAAIDIVHSHPHIECCIQRVGEELVHYVHQNNVNDYL
jgi:thymidine phosphorylase